MFFRSALETDLKIEREWRGTLQRSLDQEKQRVAQLQAEQQHSRDLRKVRVYTGKNTKKIFFLKIDDFLSLNENFY